MMATTSFRWWIVVPLFAALFLTTAERLKRVPRQTVAIEIQVALPLFMQVLMAMGDRNLAANIATTRAMVVSTEKMRPEDYQVLAKVQKDASWLNPAQEDNYYIGFAILGQYGQLDAAQTILARASHARYFDYQPSFFYAFNQWYYRHDPVGAAEWLRKAAIKLPDADQRLTMQNMAARWIDKADNIDMAIGVVQALADDAKRKDFRAYLEMRVARLRMLKQVRAAGETFQQRTGRPLQSLEELVSSGILPALPPDPFGFGFEIDGRGIIMLRTSPPRS